MRVSTFIETAPEHGAEAPAFLNGAVVGTSDKTPRQLLTLLLEIEQERGRERSYLGAPRTLDLDLLLVGDVVVDEAGLRLPHPRFRSRSFVLGPLDEIAPEMIDPVSGQSVRALFTALSISPMGA
jgi:2-amino-4-hydroxy-6-hydroxymethyldihydropteridine diphosphokinase